MTSWLRNKLAVWALTPGGAALAFRVKRAWKNADLFFPHRLEEGAETFRFASFSGKFAQVFTQYQGHYCIMATGIAVRALNGLLRDKAADPAVAAGDEAGRFVISLVSGHLGGANALTRELADLLGAEPVITTATDVNQVPAIDLIAKNQGLFMENPKAVRHVGMAFIKGQALPLHDPGNRVRPLLPPWLVAGETVFDPDKTGVYVDWRIQDLPGRVLVLRPPCLVAGIGCHRGVPRSDLEAFVREVFEKNRLSIHSLAGFVTVDRKADEPGLVELAAGLGVPLKCYGADELKTAAGVPNPSDLVNKHIGMKSVCEAAVILAASRDRLVLPKQTGKTMTLAVAEIPYI